MCQGGTNHGKGSDEENAGGNREMGHSDSQSSAGRKETGKMRRERKVSGRIEQESEGATKEKDTMGECLEK